jgi:flagellar motor switch protein FliN/FliY
MAGDKLSDDSEAKVNIEQILDVEVPVVVRFGRTEMLLADVAKLGPGSLVELDRGLDDPVELMVNGRPFAKGQVVVVDGNYAMRIREILSPADRIRSLSP